MGALVKCLKKRYLGGSVALRGNERAAVLLFPGPHRFVQHENRNRRGGFAVGRDIENEFGTLFPFARKGSLSFVIVLVNVTALGIISLLPADSGRARQRHGFLLEDSFEQWQLPGPL